MRRTSILLMMAIGALAGCGDDPIVDGTGGAGATGAGGSGAAGGGSPSCGDGVIGAGEDCDGNTFAGATCESERFGPGTLACTAECTYDVTGCAPPAGCGNGTLDEGEACEGDDLGDATCAGEGFDAGTVSCDVRCMLDTSGCCADACPADGDLQCNGDLLQTCAAGALGCLEWQETTDCTTNGDVCYDGGAAPVCVAPCTDDCVAGETQCTANVVETCALNTTDGCNDWVAGTDCGATNQVCDPTQAMCVTPPSGDTCADPYPLFAGSNSVVWTATGAEYITTTPSCVAVGTVEGPDLVLEYTPSVSNYLDILIPKPTSTRWVILASDHACGTPTPELACISDWAPAQIVHNGLRVRAGKSYYFYVIDTSSGGAPLDNPLTVNLTENPVDCTTYQAQISSTSPAAGAVTASIVTPVEITFDTPVDITTGIISLTGTTTTQVFDLSLSPPEVSRSGDGTVLTIDTALFASGETVTVSWSGLFDDFCGLPIPSPANYTFDVVDCAATPAPTVTMQTPANGGTTSTLSPIFEVEFAAPIDPTSGIVDINGTSTTLSYDLSTFPAEVSFSGGDTVMTIDPGLQFQPGEAVTVSWSGLVGAACLQPAILPTWTFDIANPSCFPGQGGVVGSTETTVGTASVTTEYYVVADDDPNGWIYVGGTSDLKRIPKAGGAAEDIDAAAGLAAANLGYTMLVAGQEIYVIDADTTPGTSALLYRISTDGGATWNVEDYALFPQAPSDDFRAISHHGGLIYLVTFDEIGGQEIWTVPLGGAGQQTATLVGMVNELDCGGIAVDDLYVYLACADGDRLVRAPLASAPTMTTEVITTSYDMSTTTSTLIKDDLDNDGIADVLYARSYVSAVDEVWYVCSPAGPTPYADTLYETTTLLGYGLGFDPVAKSLFIWEDSPNDVIRLD